MCVPMVVHEAQVLLAGFAMLLKRATAWLHRSETFSRTSKTNGHQWKQYKPSGIPAHCCAEEAEELRRDMGACNVGGATTCICTTTRVRNTSCTSKGVAMICADCSIGVTTADS